MRPCSRLGSGLGLGLGLGFGFGLEPEQLHLQSRRRVGELRREAPRLLGVRGRVGASPASERADLGAILGAQPATVCTTISDASCLLEFAKLSQVGLRLDEQQRRHRQLGGGSVRLHRRLHGDAILGEGA